jgi:hypothetical protein
VGESDAERREDADEVEVEDKLKLSNEAPPQTDEAVYDGHTWQTDLISQRAASRDGLYHRFAREAAPGSHSCGIGPLHGTYRPLHLRCRSSREPPDPLAPFAFAKIRRWGRGAFCLYKMRLDSFTNTFDGQ